MTSSHRRGNCVLSYEHVDKVREPLSPTFNFYREVVVFVGILISLKIIRLMEVPR